MSRTPPPMPWLERFGSFGPTYRGDELKGYIASGDPDVDGKCYLSAAELREIAAECAAVADWMSPAAPPMEQGPVPQAPQGEGSKDSKPAPVSTPASDVSALTTVTEENEDEDDDHVLETVTLGDYTWTKELQRFRDGTEREVWLRPIAFGHRFADDIPHLSEAFDHIVALERQRAADASELATLREQILKDA